MQDEHDRSPFSALRSLVADPGRDRIFVSDILSVMQDRAIVLLVLLFALPNVVPVPPGTSAVLGAPLLLLTTQWVLGRRPWLPHVVERSSMARIDVERLIGRVGPWLVRADGLLRPRLAPAVGRLSERLAGALSVVLALILFLPIPLGNMPPAFAISVMALGFLRRDGLCVLAGITAALVSIAIAWQVAWTLTGALVHFMNRTLT